MFRTLSSCLALTATAAFAQTRPSFEVATIKPAAPLDQAKFAAAVQSGGKRPVGANVDAHRAEFLYADLKSLLCYAYRLKLDQISGPDWMSSTRFDVVAKLPEGSAQADAAAMLQSLIEERFKLKFHHASVEHPVLALVAAGRNGLKLKPSAALPVAFEGNATLKAGVVNTDSLDGSMRTTVDLKTGSSVVDTGLKGKMTYRVVPATKSMHVEFSMASMGGLADMLTQLFTQFGGATGGRQIVDMTGIPGNYDTAIEIPLTYILALQTRQRPPVGGPGDVASDPVGDPLMEAVKSMGLKLESRKAPMDQFVVDHIEKTPTEN
jgi:uncharacterized protein (TIGR03435 family)